jgi:hypothetical protein
MRAAVKDVPRPSMNNADQLAEPVPVRATLLNISHWVYGNEIVTAGQY